MLGVSCYSINENIFLEGGEYNNPPYLAFIKLGTTRNDLILIPLGTEGGVVYSDLSKDDTKELKELNYSEGELGEELILGYKLTQGVDEQGLGTDYGHKPTVEYLKGSIIIEYKERDTTYEKQLETQKNALDITEEKKQNLQEQIANINISPQYKSSFYYLSKDKNGTIRSQKIESNFTGNQCSLIPCPNKFFAELEHLVGKERCNKSEGIAFFLFFVSGLSLGIFSIFVMNSENWAINKGADISLITVLSLLFFSSLTIMMKSLCTEELEPPEAKEAFSIDVISPAEKNSSGFCCIL